MKIDNMRELYEELLRATSNGYRNRSIANPAVDFTKKAKAGDFDEMSDEEYYQALDKVNELMMYGSIGQAVRLVNCFLLHLRILHLATVTWRTWQRHCFVLMSVQVKSISL